MNCPNCNTLITCGCQRRTASDGKQTCTSCLAAYQNKITPSPQRPNNTPPPPRYNR